MQDAWRRSRGDGPTGEKNEHGFWIRQEGSDYIAGRMLEGDGPLIDRVRVDRAHDEITKAGVIITRTPKTGPQGKGVIIYAQPSGKGVITDLERTVPCVEGATVTERTGPDSVKAEIKVKMGAMSMTFTGTVDLGGLAQAPYTGVRVTR